MLLVYSRYRYVDPFSVGIVFRRQILTFKVDPRAVRVKVGARALIKQQYNAETPSVLFHV